MKKSIAFSFLIILTLFSCELFNQNQFSQLEKNDIDSGLRIMERLFIDMLWNEPLAYQEDDFTGIHLVWNLWDSTAKAEGYLTNTEYYNLFRDGYSGSLPLTITLTKNFDSYTERYYSLNLSTNFLWESNNFYEIAVEGECIISDLYFQSFTIELNYLLDDHKLSSVSGKVYNENRYIFY